ncbi:hypothetical protein Tco_1533054 [Tanacetum coccineum]
MSSPAPTNTETIPPAGGARGSPVPMLLQDNPYMLVRHAYTSTTTDTESEPFEDPIETEEPQSLPISSAPIPSPDYTPATPHSDKELEPMEASKTRIASLHSITSPSDSISPLFPYHPLTQTSPTPTPFQAFFYHSTACMVVRTQPTLSPGITARVTEVMTLSPSLFWQRYQGTSEPIEDAKVEDTELETEREESEDEDSSSKSEEATSEDQQQ